ncbi:MAG: hypothetical protein HUK02_05000 [Bacteroidaceae bacterium]|nr:hypothetical protein [Bacteroidaceae bacterium]
MRRAKLQNHISTSRLTLPLVVLTTLALWWWPTGYYTQEGLVALLLCACTTYVILETNNSNLLIRVRSRAVSSVWLVTIGAIGWLHVFSPSLVATLCVAMSFYVFFPAYQHPQPVVEVFHTFLLLAVACLCLPQTLFVVPFYYWHLAVFLRAFTFRSFLAGLMGFLLPALFVGCYCLLREDPTFLLAWWDQWNTLVPIAPQNYQQWALPELLTLCFCAVVVVWCLLMYFTHRYDDKIRTRMLYYIYIFQTVVLLAVMVLQPQYALELLPMMLVCATPVVAHYFTLTTTWVCTVIFLLAFLGLLVVALVTMAPEEISSKIINILIK